MSFKYYGCTVSKINIHAYTLIHIKPSFKNTIALEFQKTSFKIEFVPYYYDDQVFS